MAEDRLRINPSGNPEGINDIDASQLKVLVGGEVQRLGDVLGEGENPTTLTALANDPDTTTGLTYGYKAGNYLEASGTLASQIAGTVGPLPDDTEEITIYQNVASGLVEFVVTGAPVPPNAILMAAVETAAGEIILPPTDLRTFVNGRARFFQSAIADGGFASADELDLTVVVGAGTFLLTANGFIEIDTSTVTLTDDAENYVEWQCSATVATLVATPGAFTPGSYPVGVATTVAGEVTAYVDGRPFASIPAPIITKVTTVQFDKTNEDTLENIPDLSVNVAAGGTYVFEATLFTVSNIGTGVKTKISGTATATSSIVEANIYQSGIQIVPGTTRDEFGQTIGDVTAVTVARIDITGTIVVDAGGTLTVQFAENTAIALTTSSVLIGSKFTVTRVS